MSFLQPHEVPESYKRNWREKSSSSTEGPDKKPVIDEEDNVPLLKVKIERVSFWLISTVMSVKQEKMIL